MCPPDAADVFKAGCIKVLEPENIVSDPDVLAGYSKDISFAAPSKPLLAVYPGNKDEVQKIVRLANETRTPIIPVSSGTPRFHGDTVPSRGGVIVDFSRMKRIMNVDPINRCAMVEAGVTYGELIPELKKHGLRLNIPLLPRVSKSVVTSRLELEPNLIPKYQYDFTDPLMTLEVVYRTGEDLRTGSASGPGPLETLKADKVNPWGPGMIDYFRFLTAAQGTMGLVTWAMTKAEVLPSIQKLFFIPVDDIGKLTAPMAGFLKKRVVDECLALNSVSLAAILAEDWPEDFSELKTNLPPWTVMACVAGYERRPEERIGIMEKYLADICRDLGLKPQTTLQGAEGKESAILELLSGPWEKEPYWKLRYKGACNDIFFLTTLSQASRFIDLTKEVAARYIYPIDDIGCYVQPMVQGRGCCLEFNFLSGESSGMKMFLELSETLIKSGAYFNRPYGPWAEMVYRRYAEGVTILKKLKDVFDPNNILNPGKLCF